MEGELILRLFLAGVLGALIGLEREYRAKEAGYRTHFLVSLGSALIMIVSQYGFLDLYKAEGVHYDSARLAAQVVTGIGFIGAGTIILQKQVVRGLTTAAGVWATSGVGLTIGAGMYVLGVSAAVLTLVGLELLSVIFKSVGVKSLLIEFSTTNKQVLNDIRNCLESKDSVVSSYQMEQSVHGSVITYQVSMVVKVRRNSDLLAQLRAFQDDMVIYRIE